MKGLALIVVVGVLGVLAILAAAFVAMAQLERRASGQRVNAAKAYLLARSGIEDALARLEAGQDPAYGGEDWDASGGPLSAFEVAQEVYRRGEPNVEDCPVRHALRPSFFARMASGNPVTMAVDGKERGFSGKLTGNHATAGNAYALQVYSGQGFHVNGGDPCAPPAEGYNAVLKRMLGTLAKAIDEEAGGLDGRPLGQGDGERLVDARPLGGWRGFQEIKALALGGSQDKLDALRPYLCLQARVDRKVIAPNADEAVMTGKRYRSWGEIKLDHRETRAGSRAPDFERIVGRIVGRAPVDLAWARTRRPALIALLGGLKGLYLEESPANPIGPVPSAYVWDGGDWMGTLRPADIRLDWSPGDDCHRIAAQILASTSDLATWEQWDAFCERLDIPDRDPAWWPSAAPPDRHGMPDPWNAAWKEALRQAWARMLKQAKRDLLKAHFNPNSRLNKFNPDASMRRAVDKQDLLAYTTEFGLLPAAAPRSIRSLGRVLGPGGRPLAVRALAAAPAGPSLVRLTTQKEFVCEDLGGLGIAGDERGFRLPGEAPFISRSRGFSRAWGHDLGQAGLGAEGAALQTCPEPVVDDGSGLSIRPADYDGCIRLAGLETRADDTYGAVSPPGNMMMLARYTGDMDLDVADAGPASAPNQADAFQVARSEMGLGLLDAAKPNTLYPDGCYSEKDRAPAYLDKGNADGFHGVMSFWIKSNHAPPASGEHRYRGHPFVKRTRFLEGEPRGNSTDQFFFLGDSPWAGWAPRFVPVNASPQEDQLTLPTAPRSIPLVFQFEVGSHAEDTRMEHAYVAASRPLLPGRWHLLTAFWDSRGVAPDQTGALLVDSGLRVPTSFNRTGTAADAGLGAAADLCRTASPPPGDRDDGDHYYASAGLPNDPSQASDLTEDDRYGPHRLCLGGGRPLQENGVTMLMGSGADATFDEFAVYDFGGALPSSPASPLTLAAPSVLALNRFLEGRCYKESLYLGLAASAGVNSAGEYFSPPIRLPGPCRILGLSWTQVVPPELRTGVDMAGDPPPDAGIGFELVDVAGTSYLLDARGRPVGGPLSPADLRFSDDVFSPVDRLVDRPFRLHAVFQPNLADPINTPILDPLALDDVTLLYEPAGAVRMLAYDADPGE